LQKARTKIAIGSLLDTFEFNHVKQGSSVWHNRGGALSRQDDGVSVVVQGRESLLYGEGRQLKDLPDRISNLSEVKTSDN
jgi:hypothetical protein